MDLWKNIYLNFQKLKFYLFIYIENLKYVNDVM